MSYRMALIMKIWNFCSTTWIGKKIEIIKTFHPPPPHIKLKFTSVKTNRIFTLLFLNMSKLVLFLLTNFYKLLFFFLFQMNKKKKPSKTKKLTRKWELEKNIPTFCGRAIQLPPVPCFSMYCFSFASSSGDHGPFFTFALSQQGALPMISLTFLKLWYVLREWLITRRILACVPFCPLSEC